MRLPLLSFLLVVLTSVITYSVTVTMAYSSLKESVSVMRTEMDLRLDQAEADRLKQWIQIEALAMKIERLTRRLDIMRPERLP